MIYSFKTIRCVGGCRGRWQSLEKFTFQKSFGCWSSQFLMIKTLHHFIITCYFIGFGCSLGWHKPTDMMQCKVSFIHHHARVVWVHYKPACKQSFHYWALIVTLSFECCVPNPKFIFLLLCQKTLLPLTSCAVKCSDLVNIGNSVYFKVTEQYRISRYYIAHRYIQAKQIETSNPNIEH